MSTSTTNSCPTLHQLFELKLLDFFKELWKRKKRIKFLKRLIYLMVCGCELCWVSSRLLVSWLIVGTRSSITGKFRTSCLQTSQIRVPFVLNHLMAQCSWTSLRSPLQLHSIFKVLPSSHTSRQILHTASSSGISSSVSSAGTGVIWSANENRRKKEHRSVNLPFHWSKSNFFELIKHLVNQSIPHIIYPWILKAVGKNK